MFFKKKNRFDPSEKMTPERVSELFQMVKAEHKRKQILNFLWSALIGLCTIVAAVFSVLAYFK